MGLTGGAEGGEIKPDMISTSQRNDRQLTLRPTMINGIYSAPLQRVRPTRHLITSVDQVVREGGKTKR